MRDIEGIEKVIDMLAPHWSEIHRQFEMENEKYKKLLGHSHDELGRVLKCHLILEHYLDRFLADYFRMASTNEAKLTFFQKTMLLPSEAATAAIVKPGILNINKIRNRFSHQLNYIVERKDLTSVYELLNTARAGINFDSIEAIEAFTTVACTWLIIPPKSLEKIFTEAFSEVQINIHNEIESMEG